MFSCTHALLEYATQVDLELRATQHKPQEVGIISIVVLVAGGEDVAGN